MSHPSVPLDLTSFVGRTSELDRLAELLPDSRLITLTGGPGTGKTRLARELVATRLPGKRALVWTELAALREPEMVVSAVADATGLHAEVGPGDVDKLVRILGAQDLLLVLDNCEHLVDAAAELVDRLLRECPGLSVLATSREALGVRGERAWLVPPLSLPTDESGTLGDSEAVRLFVERARESNPDFHLSDTSAGAVAEICRRLDGIPLAIELAAARTRVLTPMEMMPRLDNVFRLLTDDRRAVIPRHRTLHGAIDWSHELLEESCRVLLRRLAVFRGGFTLEAAETVGADPPLESADILELVGRLVGRSLLVMRERDGFARYHLLEAVRQYALERLRLSGEEPESRRRHALHFAGLVRQAEPHLTGRDRRVWVERLLREMDNVRSALEWTRREEPRLHVEMAGRLWWFWFSTQHWTEGGRWIDEALALPEAAVSGPDRARLLFAAGALASLQVRPAAAVPLLEETVSLAGKTGDERLGAYARNYLGLTHAGEGRPLGAELCREAEAWFRSHDDLYGLRLALLLQGSVAMATGRLDNAERMNRDGVEVARRFGLPRELAVSLQNLAVVLVVQGRLDEAESLLLEAVRHSRTDPSPYFIATGLSYLGEIEGRRGRPLEAARLLGAAEAMRDRVGARAFRLDRDRLDALLPDLRAQAGEDEFARVWSEGRATDPDGLLKDLAQRTMESFREPRESDVVGAPVPSDEPPGDTAARARPTAAGAGGLGSAPSHAALEVEALGRFRVTLEGVEVPADAWRYAKPRELLVHLLLHPEGRSRDQIGEALWPGAAPSNVKNSFHVTLHHLRKALGRPEWIGVEGERYRLDPDVSRSFDADRFEAEAREALARGDVAAIRGAQDLWRGELLEGDPAGRWIDPFRERLHRLSVELQLARGRLLEETDPGAAAEVYRALAAREVLDEEVHRRYMTALRGAGDRVGALRHYERLVELLRSELDAEPEAETRALYEGIRQAAEA